MAVRSTYLFRYERDYNDARDHLYREMRDDYYDNNKIWFRDSWGSCARFDWEQCYRIQIYDECSDIEKAVSIIREHGGRYYDE